MSELLAHVFAKNFQHVRYKYRYLEMNKMISSFLFKILNFLT